MNLLLHLVYILVLDWLLFQYIYNVANRFTILNFHETAFLPARYIISGVLVGCVLYWVYLIPIRLLKRFWPRYEHPRWWLLWWAVAAVSSVQVMSIVRNTDPIVDILPAIGLVVHLQILHFIMLMVAQRVVSQSKGSIIPGVRTAVLFMGFWWFWLWYSFEFPPADGVVPVPPVGTPTERMIITLGVVIVFMVGVSFRLRLGAPYVIREQTVFQTLTIEDMLDAFYSALGLYFLLIPLGHFLLRGYVISHSTLFPTIIEWAWLPFGWSAIMMWFILFISQREKMFLYLRPILENVRRIAFL